MGYDRASGLQPESGPVDAQVRANPQVSPYRGGLTEGFDDITTLPASGWALQNNSSPVGTTGWFQGNDVVFPSQSGDPTAYIGANFNNTTGLNTISNWLMTPELALANGTEMTFWARAIDGGFPDRLQVRLSTAGASTDVGATATSVGDFDELLLDINPNYEDGVFINEWVQYTVTVSGLDAPTSGRFAFRYFVENGGPLGSNSDFIGIDEVSVSGGVVTGPANDDIANAELIDEDGTYTGSNVDATPEEGEPEPSCSSGGLNTSVWWTYTPTGDGTITINTGGSDFDTVLTLHTEDLAEVACDDDGGEGLTSLIEDQPVTNGTTYLVRIAGWGAQEAGNISFDFSSSIGGGSEQVSLPVTFEDENVDYELTDFGGNASTLVEDPTDATNTVVQSIRTADAECFAGTTVANDTGFTEPIPFAPGETTMSVRVWSPEAGTRVRFKVEKFDDPTISVEADEFTTVAMAWETLVYDFTEQVPGTAPLNFDAEYTKASIFFNFQCGVGDEDLPELTYYWDDVAFGVPDMGVMTIAEARAAGVGTTVTVQGVVTRAMGAFTYFQDETAGLTIRQTTGAFFDAVADGTIAEGTEIQVTGTLSQFNSLLQINAGDLDSFEIISQGNEVVAQEVSVQEILDNGEAYEAELVEIDDLTTDATGEFTAATNYDVTDETGTAVLRVPNAADSDVDGLPIPEGEFTFTGVVGQFSASDPAAGYQLLAIGENDIEAQGPPGAIEFDPEPLVEMLASGETGTETVTLINNTESDVAFDFSQYSGDPDPATVAPASEGRFGYLDLAKGEADPRRGDGQSFGEGGPDAFGYRWIDSNEPGGPTFNWVDISGTGTAVTLGDDAGVAVDLPFTFSFYGNDKNAVTIGSNGYITFDGNGSDFSNDPIPTAATPNDFIAPFWDDLDPGDGNGTVYYQDMGDGRFVVQYEGVPDFPGPGVGTENTFQVILNQSGSILFQYQEMLGDILGATVGIENADGTDGLQIAFNEAYVEDGLAVLIQRRPQFVTDVEPATGTIPAGGSVDVDVTFDASGLIAGSYQGTLIVETDLEADPSTFELPVILEVSGMAACAITAETISFDATIVGTSSSEEATVTNGGTAACELTAASASGPFAVEDFSPITLAPDESTTFTVVYSPTAAGDDTGTLTVNSSEGDLTAALSGSGLDEPTPEVSVDGLTFNVAPGGMESQTFTISNIGGDDAADLEFEIAVAEALMAGGTPARSTPRTLGADARLVEGVSRADGSTDARPYVESTRSPRAIHRNGGIQITHSESFVIVDLTGIACSSGGSTTQNSYWRVFDLDDFGLTSGLTTSSVDIGIETANLFAGPVASTVRLYRLDGAFTTANLELVAEATYTINDTDDLSIVNVPVVGEFDAGDVLVVEWDVPNLQDSGSGVFFGANSEGQTGPTYVSAESCGLVEPTDLASIGFPDVHWVLAVNGEAGSSLLTVEPDFGVIAPGDDQEITVTADATETEPGTYEFELLIATNDPSNPTLTIPVTVNVSIVANEDDAVPTVFALDQNYPNPFARATTIKYALPEAAHVTVEVYDAVGRRVAVLVDAEQPVGYHEARWEAGSLASGVYLYRITAGAFTKTLKMSVVR